MRESFYIRKFYPWLMVLLLLTLFVFGELSANTMTPKEAKQLCSRLSAFELSGQSVMVNNLTIKRDRVEMTFTGRFYFERPHAGAVRGAVFIGRGAFHAPAPPSIFERENLNRLLSTESVDTDFKTAALRFTDPMKEITSLKADNSHPISKEAGNLAHHFDSLMLKETGANVAARIVVSILNQEKQGFFIAQFDKGKLGRFTCLWDPLSLLPSSAFEINGGESGLIFAYRKSIFGNNIWMAFFGQEEYKKDTAAYSDTFDMVSIKSYVMDVDLTEPKDQLKLQVRMNMEVLRDGLHAIPLLLNDGLGEYEKARLKNALRVTSASLSDGKPVEVIQEDWESGFTVFLDPRKKGEIVDLQLELAGKFMKDVTNYPCFFPRSTTSWFPRHGYLQRSTFDLTFRHQEKHTVASIGLKIREDNCKEDPKTKITQWKMDQPVPLAVFGIGQYKCHTDTVKIGKKEIPVEFYGFPKWASMLREKFFIQELKNTTRYFSSLYGTFPYPKVGAIYYPARFGQGFASLLLLPGVFRSDKDTFSFIAHECSHQWWGNIVGWRSYRDQWLSEGFAEYSGLLYTASRDEGDSWRDLLREMRNSLKHHPRTDTGVGKGKLVDIGPLILGHRLLSHKTLGAYQTLIYNKGALVLRMLHFLMSNPSSRDDNAFFVMMKDFVQQFKDDYATTESFAALAGDHFARTPIARKYNLKDLNWFFRQWVYETHLPTYRLEYNIEKKAGGGVEVKGVVHQDNAPENWFTPLPLVIEFSKDRYARGTVHVKGKATPFSIPLPMAPKKVTLDPDQWILSEKTTTKRK